ncbi:PREDICTED: agamous-like MADS-box protein AGL62 [Theobroma cacao]|uniref:Agamous-like MADS-box protein AGL62 n=2 Tax=Theobroma cacao TaxID=3641 RepID=A0AB32VD38_THECC|nr:PREDICTED: agamous-like MADS-box protein AGL62 [Theobroma cacao]EOY21132.1 Mads box protein, putative [Theobroma cacao]
MLNQQKMTNQCCGDGEEGKKKPAGKTKGRQRIEIKQLEKKSNLHVTFSKRRKGLFKKASELCILSGAKIGIIVLSPSPREKPFCFGHPDIDTVLDQYLSGNPAFDDQDYAALTDLPGFEEIDKQYEESLKELEKEKKRGKEIEQAKNVENNGGFWWDEAIDGMRVEELEAYMKAMEKLKKNLILRASALMMANVMETVVQADHSYGFGGS